MDRTPNICAGPFGALYDFYIERPWLMKAIGRTVWGIDASVLYDSMEPLAGIGDGKTVVDVPCGGGVAFRALRSEHDVRYVAIDIDEKMLARARARALELKLGDAAHLPWPDGAFTVALSANTFFFLQQPELVLAELHRVVSPGGRVVIGTVPGPLPTPSLRNWWVWVWGSRMHVYDDESMRSMLDAAGFAEVAVTRSSRSAEPLQLVRAVRR
ncbi:MAG TPA: methyltransferase domain-containing protein [Solirubrobacteraceae bacterium]|nr:methyltransferase domain-containing protein [Solirubrobacteraceae bacterium]